MLTILWDDNPEPIHLRHHIRVAEVHLLRLNEEVIRSITVISVIVVTIRVAIEGWLAWLPVSSNKATRNAPVLSFEQPDI